MNNDGEFLDWTGEALQNSETELEIIWVRTQSKGAENPACNKIGEWRIAHCIKGQRPVIGATFFKNCSCTAENQYCSDCGGFDIQLIAISLAEEG